MALADPELVRWLRVHFGTRLSAGPPAEDGRVPVDIGFPPSHDDPARELAGYAGGIEVLEPGEVRSRLAEIGEALVSTYGA
jgi:hypothetical protein